MVCRGQEVFHSTIVQRKLMTMMHLITNGIVSAVQSVYEIITEVPLPASKKREMVLFSFLFSNSNPQTHPQLCGRPPSMTSTSSLCPSPPSHTGLLLQPSSHPSTSLCLSCQSQRHSLRSSQKHWPGKQVDKLHLPSFPPVPSCRLIPNL